MLCIEYIRTYPMFGCTLSRLCCDRIEEYLAGTYKKGTGGRVKTATREVRQRVSALSTCELRTTMLRSALVRLLTNKTYLTKQDTFNLRFLSYDKCNQRTCKRSLSFRQRAHEKFEVQSHAMRRIHTYPTLAVSFAHSTSSALPSVLEERSGLRAQLRCATVHFTLV